MSLAQWTHPANWSEPFEEEVEFRTEIITSRDGSEQRIAQRVNPRLRYRWEAMARGAALEAVERRLAADQGRELVFSHPLGGTFVGRLAGPVQVRAVTNRVVTFAVEAVAAPGRNAPRSVGEAQTTFEGREVFDIAPDWSGGVTTTFEQMREVHDTGRGLIDYSLPQNFTSRVFTMRYVVRDEATYQAIVGQFYRARGRQGAFFAPAWVQSLTPLLPASAGPNLAFEGSELRDACADQPMYRHVRIRTKSSGTLIRTAAGITVDGGGNSVMVLTEHIPEIPRGDVIEMHWLLRCRHESDRLALDWETDRVARVSLTLRALKEGDE